MPLLSPIDLPSVPDFEYLDRSAVVVNGIDNPVVPLPDPVPFLRRELLAAEGPRVFSERPDALDEPYQFPFGTAAKLVGRSLLDEDFIICHCV